MNGWRWTLVRSSLRSRACAIRHIRLIAPLPSRIPAPRQHISGITQSLGFLGHPTRWGIWLVAYSDIPESRQRITPFRRLMDCDLRSLLYAGIHSDGCYVPLDNVAWIHIHFGPGHLTHVGRFCLTTLQPQLHSSLALVTC